VRKNGINSSVVFFPFLCILAVTLSGTNNEPFRGLLVQGRQVADASPVGAFSSFTTNTRASDCTPAEVLTKKQLPIVSNQDRPPPPLLCTQKKIAQKV